MLRVNLMVCRNCQQVFSLTAGSECPMCHSPLYMSVFVEEAAQQSVQSDGDDIEALGRKFRFFADMQSGNNSGLRPRR